MIMIMIIIRGESLSMIQTQKAVRVLTKKRKWSAPVHERIANFWWKKAYCLYVGITDMGLPTGDYQSFHVHYDESYF